MTSRQCAIGDGQLRRNRQHVPLQIEQQIAPVMGTLARDIGEADQLFFALWHCADDDEDALCGVFQARLYMDAIGPGVDAGE